MKVEKNIKSVEEGQSAEFRIPEFKANEFGMGFTCKICFGIQTVSVYEKPVFLVCNQCLNDLREIILKKRSIPID